MGELVYLVPPGAGKIHIQDPPGMYSLCGRNVFNADKTTLRPDPKRLCRACLKAGRVSGFKLKPKERAAILAGERPEIVRPYESGQPCPFVKGEQVTIKSRRSMAGNSPLVWIVFEGHNRTKQGDWKARYLIRDDRSLYLAKGPGYTRSASSSLDPDAAVLDEETLKEYAVQGKLRREERAEDQKAREKALRERLRVTLKDLEPTARLALLAALEREISLAQTRAKNPSADAA